MIHKEMDPIDHAIVVALAEVIQERIRTYHKDMDWAAFMDAAIAVLDSGLVTPLDGDVS